MAGWLLSDAALAGGGGGGGIPASERYLPDRTSDAVDLTGSVVTVVSIITTGGSAHTPGSYVQVDASLSEDVEGIMVWMPGTSQGSTNTSMILEIGIGAAASEVVWAQILVGYRSTPTEVFIPGFIASGTRVAVRLRGAQTARSVVTWYFRFIKATSTPVGAPVSLGIDTATSKGVVLTDAANANEKSAWVEIEDSTPSDFTVAALYVQMDGNTTMTSAAMLIDVGIGSAGNEVVIMSNVFVQAFSSEAIIQSQASYVGVDIPAGSRLSARYQSSVAADNPDVSLVCA